MRIQSDVERRAIFLPEPHCCVDTVYAHGLIVLTVGVCID